MKWFKVFRVNKKWIFGFEIEKHYPYYWIIPTIRLFIDRKYYNMKIHFLSKALDITLQKQ